ncbi:MAG: UxaA family hydrolase [Oscillospiraceae bacterium]|nr:UxaA family hydrolase [Oscillospiraceae bacterium]
MNGYVHASERDNLVTCVKAMRAGERVLVDGREIEVKDDIPKFHKLAIAEIPKGGAVYKYGEVMGVASRDIHVGEWAHIHNIDSTRGRGDKAGKEQGT